MTQLVVKNEGGPGRFCIMPSAVWPTTNFKVIRQCPEILFLMLQPFFGPMKISVKFDTVIPFEPVHEISNNVVCATSKASDQLLRAFASCLSIL